MTETQPLPGQRPVFALGLRLAATLMMSLMFLGVKVAGVHGIPLAETMFWRQLIPTVLIGGYLVARGQLGRLRTANPRLHLTRGLIGTTGMFFTLGAVRLLPLAEATVLSFTTPVFAVLLSVAMLRESVGPWRWTAVLLGLLGVIVITGPDRAHIPMLGLAVGLLAALSVALVSIQLRQMSRTEKPMCVVFWFSALGVVMLWPGLLASTKSFGPSEWLIVGGIGLAGLFGQFLLTAALAYGPVSSVIVMDYSQIAWATAWGWLVFGQLPASSTWVGAPLIVVAGLVILWREYVLHLPVAPVGLAEEA